MKETELAESKELCNSQLLIKLHRIHKSIEIPDERKEILSKIADCNAIFNLLFTEPLEILIDEVKKNINNGNIARFLECMSLAWEIQQRIEAAKKREAEERRRVEINKAIVGLLKFFYEDLVQYIEMVERLWRPNEKVRNHQNTKERCLKIVWDENKEAICEIFRKHKKRETFKKFKYSFNYYLKCCAKSGFGRTIANVKIEKRKPRTPESKARSRAGALKRRGMKVR